MRYVLSLCILFLVAPISTALAQNGRIVLAQAGQTVAPPPLPQLPPIASTSTACLVNCDTATMNCLNACVVVGPAAPGAITSPTGASGCNNACTSQQLVCKQGCTR